MERIIGIGGVFLKARDPSGLAAWYSRHLGIEIGDDHCANFPCTAPDGSGADARTVWSIFPADSDYFSPSPSGFMINYRVADLTRMLDQLRRGGVEILGAEDYDYGRFAWVLDPEGNKIELWEPRESA